MYEIRDTRDKYPTKLQKVLAEKGISNKKLVEMTGLANSSVSEIKSGMQPTLHLSTAKKICNAIGCTLDEGFGDGNDDIKTVILKRIEQEMYKVEPQDVESNLWWAKFNELVKGVNG